MIKPVTIASSTSDQVRDEKKNDAVDAMQAPAKSSVKAQKQMREEVSTKKSAAALANFFKKPPKKDIASSSRDVSEEITFVRDFDKHFHPFRLKKNATLAPANLFTKRRKETIVIDPKECNLRNLSAKGSATYLSLKRSNAFFQSY